MDNNKAIHVRFYVIAYTIIFLVLTFVMMMIFSFNGKIFIWNPDGAFQHYVAFNYLCDYLKDLCTGPHSVPWFNFTIGQGADILTTLNSYDFTDPISFLAAIIFPLPRYYRYVLMVFLKLYISGLSVFVFLYINGLKNGKAYLVGALSYAFSTNVLFMFARHPNFVNWSYFFPLLLASVELYKTKGKKAPLILMVFLNIITNYYTFYMNALQAFIYIIVRSSDEVIKGGKEAVKKEINFIIKTIGVVSVGVLLSSVVLLPTVYAYINNSRLLVRTGYTESMWLFPIDYYKQLVLNVVASFTNVGYMTYIGLNFASVCLVLAFVIKPKRDYWLRTIIVICGFMICIPLAGCILNGFGYVTNRWIYSLILYLSVACAYSYDSIEEESVKTIFTAYVLCVFYVALCCKVKRNNMDNGYLFVMIMTLLFATLMIAFYCLKRAHLQNALLCMILISSVMQTTLLFSSAGKNYVSQFMNAADIETAYKNYSSTAVSESKDSFFRIEKEEQRTNVDGINKTNGASLWWSVIPSYVVDYHVGLGLDSVKQNCYITGLDGRSGLMELAGVKYYTRRTNSSKLLPYGYSETKSSNGDYQVFINDNVIPLGYVLSGYITKDYYNSLDGVEKEQALMQAAVVDFPIEQISEKKVALDSYEIEYTIKKYDGTRYEGNELIAERDNASVSLSANIPQSVDLFLCLDGVELKDGRSSVEVKINRQTNDSSITKAVLLSNSDYTWPVIRDDVCFDLGCGESGESTITIEVCKSCCLEIDNIRLVAVPEDSIEAWSRRLKEHILSNQYVGNDVITGEISLNEKSLLQFAVPYSNGWTAYIDGEKTEIINTDIMYMSIIVPEGKHRVELHYRIPFLRAGLVVSTITVLMIVVIYIRKRFKCKEIHTGITQNTY